MPPGGLELELGYVARDLPSGWQHQVPFLAKLSLTEWIQLQAGGGGLTFAPGQQYLDEGLVAIKVRLSEQARIMPSTAFSLAVGFPSRAGTPPALAVESLQWIAYVTKDLGPIHADLNVGLNLYDPGRTARAQPWVALALSAELPRRLGVMVEGYYFSNAVGVASEDAGVLGAFTWSPRPYVTLDVGGDVGLIPGGRLGSVFVGCTFFAVDLWDVPAEVRARAERAVRP